MRVYILRETDGIDEWILGVYASSVAALDKKYELEKQPRDYVAVYGVTEHVVIE